LIFRTLRSGRLGGFFRISRCTHINNSWCIGGKCGLMAPLWQRRRPPPYPLGAAANIGAAVLVESCPIRPVPRVKMNNNMAAAEAHPNAGTRRGTGGRIPAIWVLVEACAAHVAWVCGEGLRASGEFLHCRRQGLPLLGGASQGRALSDGEIAHQGTLKGFSMSRKEGEFMAALLFQTEGSR